MLIILEGVDGCGKTRLAKKLCRTYNATYRHISKPKTDNPFLEYVKTLQRLDVNKNYVFDRCFHGERAYGPTFRNCDGLSDEKQFYLEMLVKRHHAKVIYCWQGNNEIAAVFAVRGEKHTKLENVPALNRLYETTMNRCTLPVLRYRWSTSKYDTVKKFLRKPPFKAADFPEMIGDPRAEVLLVGDQKNENLKKLPVFCSASGMFLMNTLMSVGGSFAIVNSRNKNKDLTWTQIFKFSAKVVFLGGLARKRVCKGYDISNTVTISHPQYAKRFYGNDALERYINELKEAIQ